MGSTATIGYIFGLPLDIRHIAFASANFIHGIFNIYANTGEFPEIGIILVSLFGVMVIGMINLLVSFSLPLPTAPAPVMWKSLSGNFIWIGHLAFDDPTSDFYPA